MPVLVCYKYGDSNGTTIECHCIAGIGHQLYLELQRVASKHPDATTIMHAYMDKCPARIIYQPESYAEEITANAITPGDKDK